MKKHIVSWLALLCVLLCVLPGSVWAAERDIPVSGVCGEGVSWTLKGGTLTVSGSGAMDDFQPGDAPWSAAGGSITAVVVEAGVTKLGKFAFSGCRNLTEVTFQGEAPAFSENTFSGVISWARYPRDNGTWTENLMQDYGGVLVWQDYCLHSMTDWTKPAGYDDVLRSVCHRGSSYGPENTLTAYEMAKKQGFCYVEADVQFTKDGIPVLLHDSTIDRTSDGSGALASYTYEELCQFDFGSWKGERFAGTRIPTFEEFLQLCGQLGLKPYIELKAGTPRDEVTYLVDMAEVYGIKDSATWISFDEKLLEAVADADPAAQLGYLTEKLGAAVTEKAKALAAKTGNCFVSCYYSTLTQEGIGQLRDAGVPLEVWTVNDTQWISSMDPYISGVTSDTCLAGKLMAEAGSLPEEAQEEQRFCLWCDHVETRNGDAEPVMAD